MSVGTPTRVRTLARRPFSFSLYSTSPSASVLLVASLVEVGVVFIRVFPAVVVLVVIVVFIAIFITIIITILFSVVVCVPLNAVCICLWAG